MHEDVFPIENGVFYNVMLVFRGVTKKIKSRIPIGKERDSHFWWRVQKFPLKGIK